MPTRVQIDGIGVVELDDSFKTKSQAEQNAIINDIAKQHSNNYGAVQADSLSPVPSGMANMPWKPPSPDESAASQQEIKSRIAPNVMSQGMVPDAAYDVLTGNDKAAGHLGNAIRYGTYRGLSGIVGLPGDIQDAGAWLSNKAESVLGDPAVAKQRMENYRRNNPGLPDSDTVFKKVLSGYQEVTGHPMQEPRTTGEKYASTIASFVPAAFGGPGGMMARAARVVVPAVTSETAGELTEGTKLEPYARGAGALLGGVATGIGAARSAGMGKTSATVVPTVEELKDAARQSYAAAENSGVIISKSSVNNLAKSITSDMAEAGIDQTLHPASMAVLKRINGVDQNLTLKGAETLRKIANDGIGSATSPADRMMAMTIRDHLDDFVNNLSDKDLINANAASAKQAAASLSEARNYWNRASKSDLIDELQERAKNAVGANYTRAGYENALRQQFRAVANNPNKMRRFSSDEQKVILGIVRGGPIENTLRWIGKAAPTSPLTTLIGGLAGYGATTATGLGPLGAVLPAAGLAGRSAATSMQKAKVANLSNMVRAGKLPPGSGNAAAMRQFKSQVPSDLALYLMLSRAPAAPAGQ